MKEETKTVNMKEIITFEIWCEKFIQIIQAESMGDAIKLFQKENPDETITEGEDIAYRESGDKAEDGRSEAIEFADWLKDNYTPYSDLQPDFTPGSEDGKWMEYRGDEEVLYTTEQLYEKFKSKPPQGGE